MTPVLRFKWDVSKSDILKRKRGLSFEEAVYAFDTEIVGGQKNDDPEQHYVVGFASNGLIYWKTTKEEKKWLN